MDVLKSMQISSTGLTAQRKRIEAVSSNIANAQTTRTTEGGPYRRKEVVFGSEPHRTNFSDILDKELDVATEEVHATEVVNTDDPPILKYEPNNPDANPEGYVAYPNINTMKEMADMISAQRAYEANMSALTTSKSMAVKTLDIIK